MGKELTQFNDVQEFSMQISKEYLMFAIQKFQEEVGEYKMREVIRAQELVQDGRNECNLEKFKNTKNHRMPGLERTFELFKATTTMIGD